MVKSERQIKSPKSVIGLQYTLSDSRVPHNIPPPNAIKVGFRPCPCQALNFILIWFETVQSSETDAGLIDTWPAHSTNQRFANIQSNQQLASQSTSALVAEPTTSTRKPRFLENLENFLYRELKVLGCTDSAIISEPRIQVDFDDKNKQNKILQNVIHTFNCIPRHFARFLSIWLKNSKHTSQYYQQSKMNTNSCYPINARK